MNHAITVKHLSRRVGKTSLLKDVSFDIPAGSCTALVGLNGAGKTSLLKCILDFSLPQEGEIFLFGQGYREPNARSQLAFVPEMFTPPAYLTGRRFLQLALDLHGVSTQRDWTTVLTQLELPPEWLERSVKHLSKGTLQKLGLAAGLLAGKPLLILDEPMSGLDPKARHGVRAALKEAHKAGTTLLFTSHALPDVAALCDQVLILHQGQLRWNGSVKALVAKGDIEGAFLKKIEEAPTS